MSWGYGCADYRYPGKTTRVTLTCVHSFLFFQISHQPPCRDLGVYSKIHAQNLWIASTICENSSPGATPSFCGTEFTRSPTKPATPAPSTSPTKSASPTVRTLPCYDVPFWVDIYNDGCDWYENDDNCSEWGGTQSNNGVTANNACCHCGGGSPTPPPPCYNEPGWTDIYGDGCTWYESSPADRCEAFAADREPGELTASEACCACGGGSSDICIDSQLKFLKFTNSWPRKRKGCFWVGHKNTAKRCAIKRVESHCPKTCNQCDLHRCADSARLFHEPTSDRERGCYWVSKKNTSKRCSIPGVASVCRETCGHCSSA